MKNKLGSLTIEDAKLLINYLRENDYDDFEFELLVKRLNNKVFTEEQRKIIIDFVKKSSHKKSNNIDEKNKVH